MTKEQEKEKTLNWFLLTMKWEIRRHMTDQEQKTTSISFDI